MASSNIDVAFLSRDGKLIHGIIEVKNEEPGVTTTNQRLNLLQLAAYMLSAQAHCQWGLCSKPRTDPIVGLLVYSTGIYRLSILKPADSEKTPFGLSYKFEYTDDPDMMAWVVEKYVRQCVYDVRRVKEVTLDAKYVDPKSWTSVNFDLEKGLSRYVSSSVTNMGFLFRSNAANLKKLMSLPGISQESYIIGGEIPDDCIVKYLSALLITASVEEYYGSVKSIISAEMAQQQKEAEVERVRREKDAEKEAEVERVRREKDAEVERVRREKDAEVERVRREKDAEIESLTKQLLQQGRNEIVAQDTIQLSSQPEQDNPVRQSNIDTFPEGETIISTREANVLIGPGESSVKRTESAAANAADEVMSNDNVDEPRSGIGAPSLFRSNFLGIKHPYIACLLIASLHPLLIMRNVGVSLTLLIQNTEFREKWKDLRLRRNFAYDIGYSALNLVARLQRCHNDIRLPNIAMKDDSFCLVDFDLCSEGLLGTCTTSRVVKLIPQTMSEARKFRKMMFTVSQIALVVFTIETQTEAADLSLLTRYWLTNENVEKPLEASDRLVQWACSKGPLVKDLFSDNLSLRDTTNIDQDYFFRLLHEIMSLDGAQETDS